MRVHSQLNLSRQPLETTGGYRSLIPLKSINYVEILKLIPGDTCRDRCTHQGLTKPSDASSCWLLYEPYSAMAGAPWRRDEEGRVTDVVGEELRAGAYTRPLFSSASAVSVTRKHPKHPNTP